MTVICPKCQHIVAPSALFCAECGTNLRQQGFTPGMAQAVDRRRKVDIQEDERLSRRDERTAILGVFVPILFLTYIPIALDIQNHEHIAGKISLAFGAVGVAILLGCLMRLWQFWHEQPYRLATLPVLHLFRKYERRIDGKTVYMLEFGGITLATDPASYAGFETELRYRVGWSDSTGYLTYAEPIDARQTAGAGAACQLEDEGQLIYVPLRLSHKIHLLLLHCILPSLVILGIIALVGWLSVSGKIPAPWNVLAVIFAGCSMFLLPSLAKTALGDVLSGVALVRHDRLIDKRRVIPQENFWSDDDTDEIKNTEYHARFATTGTKKVNPRIFRKLIVQQDHWIIYSPQTKKVWDIMPVEPLN